MYVYVLALYEAAFSAVALSTGFVKTNSKPSGFARISRTSKGTLPDQTHRSIAPCWFPREPQPRFVPPTKSEPSGVMSSGTFPEPNPLRNGKHAPCRRPFTFSRKQRLTTLNDWSLTKSCFWNGPNFPPVVSHAMPLAEFPTFPCGRRTG